MPIAQTTARPIATPGTASSAVAMSVSPRLLPLTATVSSPKITAPLTAPMKAPTIPCQKWSGRKTVKCQRAMPIVNQTSRAISAPPLPTSRRSSVPPVLAALLAALAALRVALPPLGRGLFRRRLLAVDGRAVDAAVAWLGGCHGRRRTCFGTGLGIDSVDARFSLVVGELGQLHL